MYGEKVHRLFLDAMKQELDNLGVTDINGTQACILMNIDDKTITMGEILSRGYYIGSNASYNIKKMIASKYVSQTPSSYDRRSVHLSLTSKGTDLCGKLDAIFDKHVARLKLYGNVKGEAERSMKFLNKVENFWQDILLRRS
jgi:DNA-binding MarR family transcriptional regulator